VSAPGSRGPSAPRPAALPLVFVLAAAIAAVGLAYRLGAWDVENDEAIYTYAAERIVDTGDWLTPRYIPTDLPFLEKPPLKFWLVAAPLRLGLLPRTEAGLRVVDVALASLAFGYVALFGMRLGGPAAAIASCLLLFGLRDLVLQHGLRSNNMEAPLVAAYCGGLYHALRWREDGRRRDAIATGAWFLVAFLCKFVAAAFLPAVAAVTLLLPRPLALPKPWRAAAADWGCAAALVVAVAAPWFVYQYATVGHELIETIFLQHVLARFTASVDVQHLQPWDFYLRQIERLLRDARSLWLAAAGGVLLVYRVVRHRDPLAALLLLWAALPIAVISGFTSKIIHYAYPYLPPVALAGGLALAAPIGMLREPIARLAARLEAASGQLPAGLPAWLARPAVRRTALGIGLAAVVVAGLALMLEGTARLAVGSVVLRNTSVVRPLVVAIVCFAIAGAWRPLLTAVPVGLLVLLPLGAARETLRDAARPAAGLRAVRDCARPLVEAGRAGRGAYAVSATPIPHPYAYYFLALGPWEAFPAADPALQRALFEPGAQRPIVLSARAFSDVGLSLLQAGHDVPPAISVQAGWTVLLPGPLGACVDDAVRAGARSAGGALGGS
jgi:4-amino-4-deoxy-L-arabinose transferase-like glycosyltransferase